MKRNPMVMEKVKGGVCIGPIHRDMAGTEMRTLVHILV